MSEVYNVYEAKTHLSELMERAVAGEDIILAKAGVEKVKLVPVAAKKVKRTPGKLKGKIWYSDDCWAPMTEEELKDWYGEDLPPLEYEKK